MLLHNNSFIEEEKISSLSTLIKTSDFYFTPPKTSNFIKLSPLKNISVSKKTLLNKKMEYQLKLSNDIMEANKI
jgi:hypothetical protein